MVNKSPSSGYVRADKDCRSQPLRAFYRSAVRLQVIYSWEQA
jgi:hypothetical protein